MSHFTVTCLTLTLSGSELDDLLAPYDENSFLEETTDADTGETYQHNPNAKWDWWTIGGRWSNLLVLKSGTTVNSARKGELDVDGMRAASLARAEVEWVEWDAAFRDLPPLVTKWPEFIARCEAGELTWDQARETYWAQPRGIAARQLNAWSGGEFLDAYERGYDTHIERAGLDLPFVGYATCSPEGWVGRGEMGWFGAGSDTLDSTIEYLRNFHRMFDAMPDAAWITMVDCHI